LNIARRSLDARLNQSRQAAFTYPEVGATRRETLPAGYNHDFRLQVVGHGDRSFEQARTHIRNWGLQRSLGFSIHPPSAPLEADSTVLLHTFALTVPTRIVYVVDEPLRFGFAYGTLPGHPEIGEEYFGIFRDSADVVRFELRAFSLPGSWYTKLGGPISRSAQRLAGRLYARSARNSASE
jgi:uncharacterized protein (UPF0548 family)